MSLKRTGPPQRRTQLARGDRQLTRRPESRPRSAPLRSIPEQTCCGKRRFATREAADAEIARLALKIRDRLPKEAYKCPLDWWHLTSQDPIARIATGAAKARRRAEADDIPAAVCRLVDARDSRDGVRLCVHCGSPRNLHRHHRRFRSQPGPHRHCVCNVVTVCDRCHTWAHVLNRPQAEIEGLVLAAETAAPWRHLVLVHSEPDRPGRELWPTCDGQWADHAPAAEAA